MYIDDLTDAVVACAEAKGWHVEAGIIYKDIDNYYEGFDVDAETYVWLDQFGHGKRGAPYRMRAVLEDMEATEKMIEELLDAIKEMEVPEEY